MYCSGGTFVFGLLSLECTLYQPKLRQTFYFGLTLWADDHHPGKTCQVKISWSESHWNISDSSIFSFPYHTWPTSPTSASDLMFPDCKVKIICPSLTCWPQCFRLENIHMPCSPIFFPLHSESFVIISWPALPISEEEVCQIFSR